MKVPVAAPLKYIIAIITESKNTARFMDKHESASLKM